jgi:PKHD-type hydroxylase
MILTIDSAITSEEHQQLMGALSEAKFVDGKATAGWHAKLVKHNTQLDGESPQAKELTQLVKAALQRHPLFKAAIGPKFIHSLLFSRYEPGMSYGLHTDNAFMGGQQFWRSDVSFTLFLSPLTAYTGGELVIESADGERSYKLEARSMVVYPSSTLHRVETVTAGVRWAAVGWVQCLVRDAAKREILFDLETVRRSLLAREGKTLEFDLLSKTHANLLRQWGE